MSTKTFKWLKYWREAFWHVWMIQNKTFHCTKIKADLRGKRSLPSFVCFEFFHLALFCLFFQATHLLFTVLACRPSCWMICQQTNLYLAISPQTSFNNLASFCNLIISPLQYLTLLWSVDQSFNQPYIALPFEIPTSVLNVCSIFLSGNFHVNPPESCSPKSVHQDLHTGGSVAFLCKQLRLCEFSWQLLVKGAALCNPTYPSITFKCLEMPAQAQNGSWRSFNFFSPAGYIDPILEASVVEKSAGLNAWVRNWLPLIYKKPLQWKHKMAPQCIEESSCVFTSQTQKVLLTSVWWVAIILQLSLLSTCRNWAISF